MGLERFFTAKLTPLGKIKIGGKGEEKVSAKGKTYRQPLKYDYFVVTTMQKDAAGNFKPDVKLMKELTEEYGDEDGKLRQIPIRLLSNDPEVVMQTAFVAYQGKVCIARSDRQTVTWFNDLKTGARLAEPKVEPWDEKLRELKSQEGGAFFKEHSVFNCVISAHEAKWGGVYEFRTTGEISGQQLYSGMLETLRLTYGVLIGMPLWMVVEPKQVTPQGRATTVYAVKLELRAPSMEDIERMALTRMQYALAHKDQIQIIETKYKALMAPPGTESAKDAADINLEFSPETADAKVEKPPEGEDELLKPAAPLAPMDRPKEREAAGGSSKEGARTTPAAPGDDLLEGSKPPKGPKPPPAMIGKDQIEELKALVPQIMTKADWLKELAKRKVERVSQLTAADALTMILDYRKQRDEKNRRGPKEEKFSRDAAIGAVKEALADDTISTLRFARACASLEIKYDDKHADAWQEVGDGKLKELVHELLLDQR
ncbi:MAG: hypothetical protein ABSA67_10165 [Candidatus Brocadiia bacterium]|jgi:hypothetical protein